MSVGRGTARITRFMVIVLAVLVADWAAANVTVVTTTEDLASLAREVGGDRVSVEALARGYQDPHLVEPKPSFILRLQRAQLLIAVGRDLEVGWLPRLIQQSRNARIQPGASGYLDTSLTARVLELPAGPITRAMGDVHALGNPHYWLDPANGRRIAQAIAQKLRELSPRDAVYFTERLTDFDRRLAEAEKRWDGLMAPYKGLKVVTFHRTWSSFAERFGLDVIGFIEPKPGIPPSAAHTRSLVEQMRRQQAKILIVEPYFDPGTPRAIGRETGADVLIMPPSVGGVKEAPDYFALFDYCLRLLIESAGRRS